MFSVSHVNGFMCPTSHIPGCVQAVPNSMLFEIPEEIMVYHMFSASVSLVDGEALSRKPGLNAVFAYEVSIPDYLNCKVVEVVDTHQIVKLYTPNRQNIATIMRDFGKPSGGSVTSLGSYTSSHDGSVPPAQSVFYAASSAGSASESAFRAPYSMSGRKESGATPKAIYENRSVFRNSGKCLFYIKIKRYYFMIFFMFRID